VRLTGTTIFIRWDDKFQGGLPVDRFFFDSIRLIRFMPFADGQVLFGMPYDRTYSSMRDFGTKRTTAHDYFFGQLEAPNILKELNRSRLTVNAIFRSKGLNQSRHGRDAGTAMLN
jgi:hypothetical protein